MPNGALPTIGSSSDISNGICPRPQEDSKTGHFLVLDNGKNACHCQNNTKTTADEQCRRGSEMNYPSRPESRAELSEVFRASMRNVPSAVAILTAHADGADFGMTATAVCSLAANPPKLLACVNRTSRFSAALASPQARDWPSLRAEQAGLGYWAAASWGGWISLSKDEPEIVADLPLAIRLAELAWAADPTWGNGALSSLLGSFEAGRAGGSSQRALGYFDQGIAQANGRSVGAFLSKAEGYAQPAGDRVLFEQLLAQALALKDQAGSPFTLQNEVMRRRARWLLLKTDDLF